MYDVIIVGGRCAGSAAALGLARLGHRVLVLESSEFPRDTISTHHVHHTGLALLRDWGVLDDVIATGCPANTLIKYDVYGCAEIEAVVPELPGIAGIYAPRRYILDETLARAAVAAGAEYRFGSRVTGLVSEGSRVAGVRYASSDGTERTEHAHLVVGADGKSSSVARMVEAVNHRQAPLLTFAYYTYWADLPSDFEMYLRPGSFVASVRTHDDLTLVAVYLPQERLAAFRRDPVTSYRETIRLGSPSLWDRVSGAVMAERLRGTARQPNFVRECFGPGWVLIGDAGCSKDSITGTGISDAYVQAELLTASLGFDLAEHERHGEALRSFADRRDGHITPAYDSALAVAELSVSEEQLWQISRIATTKSASALFACVAAGVVPKPIVKDRPTKETGPWPRTTTQAAAR